MDNYSKKTNIEFRYYYRAESGKLLKRNMHSGNVQMWDIEYQYMGRSFLLQDNEPSNVPDSTWLLYVPEKYQ